jgi:hypothetical protein
VFLLVISAIFYAAIMTFWLVLSSDMASLQVMVALARSVGCGSNEGLTLL